MGENKSRITIIILMENPHHRRSIRLPDYDYSQNGAYFITICAYQRQRIFGEIENSAVILSQIGEIIDEEWERTPILRPEIELGAYVIMPNHFHAIVHIIENNNSQSRVVAYGYTPLPEMPTKSEFRSPSRTIGSLVRGFKASVTTRINTQRNTPGSPIWQRNYYESVIRSEEAYAQIEGYILDNPLNWLTDKEYLS
jgi:REP element-mobilizing transposase RayT